MKYARIDRLETRRLLSGGLTANGSPISQATVSGQIAEFASCPIGTGETLLAYINSPTLSGVILDASSNVVVSQFTIDSGGDNINQFGKIAAVEDTNGNAVIAYTISFGEKVNLVRVNSAGQVVDAPSLAMNAANVDYATPVLAAGQNGQVGLVAIDFINTPNVVYGGVFDSSDNTLFTPAAISTIASNAPGGAILSHSGIAYISASNTFLAAWDEEDLVTGATADTQELVNDNTFAPAGVLGTQQTIATAPNNGTSDDVLLQPFLLPTADGTQVSVYYDENDFSPAPDYTFGGSNVFEATINSDGTLAGSPTNVYQTTAPNEVMLSSSLQFTSSSNSVVTSAISSGAIQPLSTVTNLYNVLYGSIGTYNGNFTPSSAVAVIFQGNTFITENDLAFAAAVSDYFGNPFGIDFATIDTTDNTSTIETEPTTFEAPVIPLPVSVSVEFDGTFTEGDNFEIKLSRDLTAGETVSVKYSTRDGTAISPVSYDETSGTASFSAGNSDDHEVTVPLHGGGVSPENFFLDLSDPNPANTTIEVASAEGIVPVADFTVAGTFVPSTTGPVAPGGEIKGTFVVNQTDSTQGSGTITGSIDGIGSFEVKYKTNKKKKLQTFKVDAKVPENAPMGNQPVTLSFAPNTGSRLTAADFNPQIFASDNNPLTLDVENIFANKAPLTLSGTTLSLTGPGQGQLTPNGNGSYNLALTGTTSATKVSITGAGSLALNNITGGTLASLSDSGNLDANLAVASIGKLTVAGILGGTSSSDYRQIRATSFFGTITVGGLKNANLFAGVDSSINILPTDESAFVDADAFIKSLTIKGSAAIFSDADVAAATIDSITISGLQPVNDTPFGLAAENILKYRQGSTSKKNITTPQTLDSSGEYSATTI